MSVLMEKLAGAGHLSRDQVSRIRKTVHEFEKLAAEDPEFHAEALEKLGFLGVKWGDSAKRIAATGATIGATMIAQDVYQTAKDAIGKAKNYKSMLNDNPDLRKVDSKKVQRLFTSLHTHNPNYAADPMTAGAFVRQQADMEGVDFGMIRNVSDARKNFPARKDWVQSMLDPAMAAGSLQFQDPQAEQLHGVKVEEAEAKRDAARARMQRNQHFNKNLGIP